MALLLAAALLPRPAGAEPAADIGVAAHAPEYSSVFIELSTGLGPVSEVDGASSRSSAAPHQGGADDRIDDTIGVVFGNQIGLHGGYMLNNTIGVRIGVRNFAGQFVSYDLGAAVVAGGRHSFYCYPGLSFASNGSTGLHLELGYGYWGSSGFGLKLGYNFFGEFDFGRLNIGIGGSTRGDGARSQDRRISASGFGLALAYRF